MQRRFMEEAIEMAVANVRSGRGGPFAALVIREEAVVGRGVNSVTSSNDPTAHAEVMAIRDACRTLGNFQLDGCDLYTTCEPCPMCLGAIYWARLDRVFYASTQRDAAEAGFDDRLIYDELRRDSKERQLPMEQVMREEGGRVFDAWKQFEKRIEY